MNFFKFAWSILPRLLDATTITLELTACSIVLGFIVGVVLALGRVYGNRPIRFTSNVYIQFFRGTPLLVQLLLIYYGLPAYLTTLGIRLSPLTAAIIGLGLNSAAYQAEYFRGAIQSIQMGQMMAARAMGMSKIRAIRHVILPQAFRIVIPSWSNELIYSIKYSSLAYFLSLAELTFTGKKIVAHTARTFETYIIVALIYLAIVIVVSRLLAMLEKHVRVPGLGANAEHH
jgi:polar amino acid transport system permease protein